MLHARDDYAHIQDPSGKIPVDEPVFLLRGKDRLAAKAARDWCAAAGVPYLFKQWGEWKHMPERAHFKEAYREPWKRHESGMDGVRHALMFRVGKKAAGRQLDGVEHNGWAKNRENG